MFNFNDDNDDHNNDNYNNDDAGIAMMMFIKSILFIPIRLRFSTLLYATLFYSSTY